MKKVIFISALAIAAAVSCTKSDIVDTKFNEQIGFETYAGRDAQTKATAIEKAADLKVIGVYGFYTGNTSYNPSKSTANLWVNLPVTNGTDGWTYAADQKKYWTNATDKYTFLAYSPYGDQNLTVSTGTVTEPKVEYAVPGLDSQVDLLYANAPADEDGKNGHVNMVRPGEGTSLQPVALKFQHALSRITVKASENVSAYNYTIKKITIGGNFNTSGTLSLATGEWTQQSSSNPVYEFYTGTDVLTNTATAYSTHGYLMPIPTTAETKTTVTVTVTYSSTFGDVVSNDMTKKVEFDNVFEKGKAYAINLEFKENTENPITFNVVEVASWGSETDVPEISLNPETGTVVPQA